MAEIGVTILVSIIISVICNRILAIRTFKVIDGYVEDMINLVKESIGNI